MGWALSAWDSDPDLPTPKWKHLNCQSVRSTCFPPHESCVRHPSGSNWPLSTLRFSEYLKFAPKLVDSMLASLELEEDGATEFEVM